MEGAGGGIFAVIDLAIQALCVAFFLYLLLKGPTRGLKIGLVVFVLAFVAVQAVKVGWAPALALLLTVLVMNLVVMMASTLILRHPLRKVFVAAGEQELPRHAGKQVAKYTQDFEALGFQRCGDRISTWKMLGQKRNVFTRFLRQGSGHCWAEIHALDEPKVVARVIGTLKNDGSVLSTVDKQANEEFFRDELTHMRRVAASSTCEMMLRAHEVFAMKVPTSTQTVQDPIASSAAVYDGWVRRLVDSRQVVVRGDSFAIPLRMAFPTAVRVIAAWFH